MSVFLCQLDRQGHAVARSKEAVSIYQSLGTDYRVHTAIALVGLARCYETTERYDVHLGKRILRGMMVCRRRRGTTKQDSLSRLSIWQHNIFSRRAVLLRIGAPIN